MGIIGIPARREDSSFWNGKRVFVTGHTGFKGSWLCIWLHLLGAKVTGYALPPATDPNLFELCGIDRLIDSHIADIRNAERLAEAAAASDPEIVIHMAAQPLVRESYRIPVETFETNVMGTVHLLEAVRRSDGIRAVVNVTTDKCYENRESVWGYRETEALGGHDPYSASKACSELVTAAYRLSYFNPEAYGDHRVAIASARAGNVIGGGDWSTSRLVPDCISALLHNKEIVIRNPLSVRPWQHVLDSLSGYLLLSRWLFEGGAEYCGAWNFAPAEDGFPVESVVQQICSAWGEEASYRVETDNSLHEASNLRLDSAKARALLGWRPRWDLRRSIVETVEWSKEFRFGKCMLDFCRRQIEAYGDS